MTLLTKESELYFVIVNRLYFDKNYDYKVGRTATSTEGLDGMQRQTPNLCVQLQLYRNNTNIRKNGMIAGYQKMKGKNLESGRSLCNKGFLCLQSL